MSKLPTLAEHGLIEIAADYEHKGTDYRQVLSWLHSYLSPKSYLEIGSFSGGSLALAKCPTIAIDPEFKIAEDVIGTKPELMLFQVGSDTFFANKDPKALFGRTIDLAFLDGMHLFEFLLRDFINTERHCTANSIIALHDCLPLTGRMAARFASPEPQPNARFSDWWTGDVWKVVAILKQYRPDLKILCLNAPPTGLVICTNLSPESTVLKDRYFSLVDEWRDVQLDTYGVNQFLKDARVMSTDLVSSFQGMASRFWL